MDDKIDLVWAKLESIAKTFFWQLPNLGLALLVALVFLGVGALARSGTSRLFKRRGRENLGELLGEFARWSVFLLGALVVAAIVFPSIKPADLLSTLGIGSIAIGFAFKDILQNWLAGLLILWRQPFRRGDQIVVGKFEGTVEHIEARATLIRTFDGRRVVIPNNDVYATSVIVNTAFPQRRSQIEIGMDYADDVGRLRQVTLDAIATIEGVAKDPAPEVLAWTLGDFAVTLRIRWWTSSKQTEMVHVRAKVVEALRRAFAEAGINLPYPTQTVLLPSDGQGAGDDDGETARAQA